MKRAVCFVIIFFTFASTHRLYAGKHPVPLEKGVTDANCTECHEDKTKGKVVHPAVQAGCTSCHVVRPNGDETRVTLKNAKTSTLCFSCHEDKKTKDNESFHKPNTDCLQCHDPHVSGNEKLLKKTTAGGSKDENLCLNCHTQGLNIEKGGSRHAALDMGCGSCHAPHKSGDRTKEEFKYHLTKVAPALCLDCHDAKDANLVKAHNGQPFATANCVQCHDPHQSKSPKLMQAFQHNPFEDKTGCTTCHEAAREGKVVLNQADSKALCATCHDEVAKKIDTAKVPHPGAQGECISCHDPHAGKSPKFLRPDPVAACETCHSNQAEAHQKKNVIHGPAFKQSCSICHAPHGGENEHLLRAKGNDICNSCHQPGNGEAGKDEAGNPTLLLFGGSVQVPTKSIEKAAKIMAADHPVQNHPVSGKNKLGKGDQQISCLSCHDAHAGAKKMLVGDITNNRDLCVKCHK